MMGRIIGFCSNKNEKFVADTGTSVMIIPRSVAVRNRVEWFPADEDEPSYEGVTGTGLTVIGQADFWVKFKSLREAKRVKALVCEEQGDEILVDLDSLIQWSIVHKDFPLPQCPKEKPHKIINIKTTEELPGPTNKLVDIRERQGSIRSTLSFRHVEEEDYEDNEDFAKLRKRLLKDFRDVFKEELGQLDRLNVDPVKIELIDGHEEVKPFNCMIPAETPRHLDSAARKELMKILAAGFLEEVYHPTDWCARSFYVQKPGPSDQDPKVRLVSDLRHVNKIIKRVGHPLDGSSHILRRLDPDDTYFSVMDLTSGYHQVPLHPDSRDLFTVILPAGKFRFTVMPQGCTVSSDYFNLLTDEDIRSRVGYFKNVDDILTTSTTMSQLEERVRALLLVCRKKNMKSSPGKFQLERRVVYGGVVIEATRQQGDKSAGVYLSPIEEKLKTFLEISTPSSKKEVQRIGGLAAQLKRWTPGLMLEFPGIQKLCANSVSFYWNADLE